MMLEAGEVRSHWTEYFGQLYLEEYGRRLLSLASVLILAVDSSTDDTELSLPEVREAMSKLKSGRELGGCSVTEMLKDVFEILVNGLHAALSVVW